MLHIQRNEDEENTNRNCSLCNLERNASSRVRDVKVKDVSFDPKNKKIIFDVAPIHLLIIIPGYRYLYI
jgi:hypothetical protein